MIGYKFIATLKFRILCSICQGYMLAMRNLSNVNFSKIKDYHFERLASQVLKLVFFQNISSYLVYNSGIDVAFLGSANGRAYRYSITLDTRLKCRRVGSWYKGNVNFRSNNVWVREFDARTTNTTTCMNRTDIGMISRATCVRLVYLVCVHSPRGCACRVYHTYTRRRDRGAEDAYRHEYVYA